jgi:hypothetical protein
MHKSTTALSKKNNLTKRKKERAATRSLEKRLDTSEARSDIIKWANYAKVFFK